MNEPLTVQESSPGRMSLNEAVTLSLVGTSLLFLSNYFSLELKTKSLIFALMILNLITITISFMAIFGYIVDLPGTYGWGSYTKMALQTALGNILLSISIISIIFIRARENNLTFLSWAPWFVFIVVEVITLSFWQASWATIEKNERQQNTIASQSIKSSVNEEINLRKTALMRMASRWKTHKGGTPYKEWYQDAINIIADQPGYQSIEWVDPQLYVKWVAPIKGNEAALNINLMEEKERPQALLDSMKEGRTKLAPILTLNYSGKRVSNLHTNRVRKNFQGACIGANKCQIIF